MFGQRPGVGHHQSPTPLAEDADHVEETIEAVRGVRHRVQQAQVDHGLRRASTEPGRLDTLAPFSEPVQQRFGDTAGSAGSSVISNYQGLTESRSLAPALP